MSRAAAFSLHLHHQQQEAAFQLNKDGIYPCSWSQKTRPQNRVRAAASARLNVSQEKEKNKRG